MDQNENSDYMTFSLSIDDDTCKNTSEKSYNMKTIMSESISTGFDTPIPKSNVGYQLLMKMGYKSNNNTIKPIIKNEKHGIGKVAKIPRLNPELSNDFRARQSQLFKQKKLKEKLDAIVNVCIELDKDENECDYASMGSELLLEYLRKKHFFCFFCSTKFDSLEELLANCPVEEH